MRGFDDKDNPLWQFRALCDMDIQKESMKHVLSYLTVSDYLKFREVAHIEEDIFFDTRQLESRIAASESKLVGNVDFEEATSAMRRAAQSLREEDFVELLSTKSPSPMVRSVALALELLLGPNAGIDVLKFWSFLRKSLKGKWTEILRFFNQNLLDIMANMATPAGLARMREAANVCDSLSLNDSARRPSPNFCHYVWPAIVRIVKVLSRSNLSDAANLFLLKKERRQASIASTVVEMSPQARYLIARGSILEAIPHLNSELELYIAVSRGDLSTPTKDATMRRRMQLVVPVERER